MDCTRVLEFKFKRIIFVFALFSVFFLRSFDVNAAIEPTQTSVSEHAESTKEKKFEIGKFALHHVTDAHSWNVIGDVYIGLPVILYSEGKLVMFNSDEFQHDDNATVVVEKEGLRFVKYHEKIYSASATANKDGQFIEYNDEHEKVNAKPLNFSITKNTITLFLSVIVLLVIFISVANSYKKRHGKSPKGLQSFLEPIILFVRDDIAKPNLGHKYERFMPYLLTVFFFIWFNNMLGLVPFLPGGANLTGNIAVTMVLALCTLFITLFNGNKYYWKHIFWMPGVPVPMKIFLMPIELIGIFTKPIALMIRLFANITAGHILIISLISLIFVFDNLFVAAASIPFAIFIGGIELMVAFIQAFIFTILSALFIGMAVSEHH